MNNYFICAALKKIYKEACELRDGARNRVRTGDLNLGKVALYQLSYSRFQV